MPQQEADEQHQAEAANPATSTQRLEVLSADPHLRSVVAGNPSASVALLKLLAQDQDVRVRQAVASNPNTPWQTLEQLAWEFPHAFFAHPAGLLQLLAHPEQIRVDEAFWGALLRVASIPSLWWNWLRSHPTLRTSQAMRLHVLYAGEAIHPFDIAQDEDPYTRLTLVELLTACCAQEGGSLAQTTSLACIAEQTISDLLPGLAQELDPTVRWAVASNRALSRTWLTALAQDQEGDVRASVVWNEQTTEELLRRLALDKDTDVRSAVAWNEQTPAEVLQRLAQDEQEAEELENTSDSSEGAYEHEYPFWIPVRKGVARNPQTPVETLRTLAQHHTWEVRSLVAENEQTPGEILCILAQDADRWVRCGVASNTQTPVEVLQTLAQDHEADVREAVAAHPQTPADVLQALAQDADERVLRSVAEHPQTPVEVLRLLAQNTDIWVRSAIASNTQTPVEVLQTLTQDQDRHVWWVANLVQKVVAESERLLGEQGRGKKQPLSFPLHRWYDRSHILDMSIEKQLRKIALLQGPDALRQMIVSILATDWENHNVLGAFDASKAERMTTWDPAPKTDGIAILGARRDSYRHIMASFLPALALQKLAASPQWEVRYLVALHEQTPWGTRRCLSQDGNRYVRAVARAKAEMTPQQTP